MLKNIWRDFVQQIHVERYPGCQRIVGTYGVSSYIYVRFDQIISLIGIVQINPLYSLTLK